MLKQHFRLALGAVLSAALLAGCGSGGSGEVSSAPVSTDISQSISALITFMNNLIAGTSESGDPIAINSLTLVTDDTAQPSPIN
ncbi:MAG: hypothetical protein H7238_00065 [Polaromonas sp.]|nr:hypothetical protein [Polaromonas sp.]